MQALYQIEQTDLKAEEVIAEFLLHRLPAYEKSGGLKGAPPEPEFFKSLVTGTSAHLNEIDKYISESLRDSWRLERIESVARAILRVAVYEMGADITIPIPILINEYIEVGKIFLNDPDPAFINACLDSLVKIVRPSESLQSLFQPSHG